LWCINIMALKYITKLKVLQLQLVSKIFLV
jgi:hypothetical protein